MSLISIRLTEKLLHEVDARAHLCKLARTEYIRRALVRMNQEVKNAEQRKRLMRASLKVREESMRINAEFDRIEHDIED